MKTATQGELADFRAFCREATLSQLRAIYEKERDAGRLAYADEAASELRERGVQP